MADTLMFWADVNERIPHMIEEKYNADVTVRNLYKRINLAGRILRKFISNLHLSTRIFFDDWVKEDFNVYKKIIIDANIINQSVPETLRKMGYKGRIIYWYWNPVCNCVSPKRINRTCCELWSFSQEDCEKYNMAYNTTYFFEQQNNTEKEIDTDIFFVGIDKGRYEKLMTLKALADKVGLKTDFRIIRDNNSVKGGNYSKRMDYSEVLNCVNRSRAIVEILQEGQTGLSLRTMEAIFMGKKLITNNTKIKNEKFYNKDVIFLIDDLSNEDISRELYEFIKSSKKIDARFKEYYNFRNWLKRFDKVEA